VETSPHLFALSADYGERASAKKEAMKTKSGKVRVSYMLSRESITFIAETRQRLNLRTNSEALEFLLRDAMLRAGKAVS